MLRERTVSFSGVNQLNSWQKILLSLEQSAKNENPLCFAASSGNRNPQCKPTSFPCGKSCQPAMTKTGKATQCQKPLQGQVKNYADWLQMQGQKGKAVKEIEPTEVVKELYFKKAEIKKPISEASVAENAALLAYGDGAFSMINPVLRGLGDEFKIITQRTTQRTGLTTEQLKAQAQQAGDLLNAALDKAPKYKGEVYRGLGDRMTLDDALKLQEGDELKDAGFSSTSKSEAIARGFSNNQVLLKIQSKTGVDIGDSLGRSQEKEVLFKAGTAFKVKQVEITEKSRLSGKPRKVVIHVEERT